MHWNDFRNWWIDLSLRSISEEWAALGAIEDRQTTEIVDPEALVAATWAVGRADARLFDAALQWSVRHAVVFDRSRLKNALLAVTAETRVVGAAWWDLMADQIGDTPQVEPTAQPIELFWRPASQEVLTTRTDAGFAQRGIRRGLFEVENIGAIGEAQLGTTASSRIGLRALMGTNARAEIVTLLLTGSRDSSWLERESWYTRRGVHLVLHELDRGGWIQWPGRGVATTRAPLRTLGAAIGFPNDLLFRSAVLRARALDIYWHATIAIERGGFEGYTLVSRLRDAVDAVDRLLREHGVRHIADLPSKPDLEQLVEVARAQIVEILGTSL